MAKIEVPKPIAECMYILQPNFLGSLQKVKSKILKGRGLLEIDEQTVVQFLNSSKQEK